MSEIKYQQIIHNVNQVLNELIQECCVEKSKQKRLVLYNKINYYRRYLELVSTCILII